MSVRLVPLGKVCTQDRISVRPGHGKALPYLGLEGIESGTGRFVEGDLSKTPEVPQANSFRFDGRHVLYGKLRPYLNKVALPTEPGKCSTEIIPLLPSSQCDRQYLSYFLRAPSTVQQIAERSAGARMPRADMDFVLSLSIPLRAHEDQRRIVDMLSRAEGIVRLRRQAQQQAAALIPAIFVDMFGDPATNPKGWPTAPLGEHVFIPSTVRTPDLVQDADHFCIGADSIESGTGTFLSRLTVREVVPKSGKYWYEPGEVLYSKIRPYLAKVALADTNGYCSADMYPLRCRATIKPRFLLSLLLSEAFTDFATAESVRAQMPKLNREALFGYKFPIPPGDMQEHFSELAQQCQSIQLQQALALQRAIATFDALLARAFSAERAADAVHEAEGAVA